MRLRFTTSGFTIVELLIVIVVIAILAAISLVAYQGVQGRANEATVQSDMRAAGTRLEEYFLDNGRYPRTQTELADADLRFSKNSYHQNTIIYCVDDLGHAGIAGRSKSRKESGFQQGFYWGNTTGGVKPSQSVGESSRTTCPQTGVSVAEGNGFIGIWSKDGSDNWLPWVKG